MALTDEQIQAFLRAHGPQLFSPRDDAEEVGTGGSVSAARRAGERVKTLAGRLPVNLALAVATGAPGIVFGIGGVVVDNVHSRVQASRHKAAVARQGGRVTLTCLACEGLPNIRQQATGLGSAVITTTTQSPYVKAHLLMDGVDYNKEQGYSAKSYTHLGGGTDFAFKEGTVLQLGFNHDDANAEASQRAAVFIEVKDQPDFKAGRLLSGRDTRIGVAAFSIYQLVEQAIAETANSDNEGDHQSSHFIHLNLYHGDAVTDPDAAPNGGILRLHVTFEFNN